MNIKEDKGLILSIFGILLTISIYGIFFGIPITIIGIYYLNKKANGNIKDIEKKLEEKQKELDNIDDKLDELEKEKSEEVEKKLEEKQKEVEKKLEEKQKELDNIDEKLDQLEKEKTDEIDEKLNDKRNKLNNLVIKINQKKKELMPLEDEVELQSYGLYEPRYDFVDSVAYKEKLDSIRRQQKSMIKDKIAAVCNVEWSIDNDKRKGQRFTTLNIKQILRAFNNESEVIINKVKHSNIESSLKRLEKSRQQLNKIFERDQVEITPRYYDLKVQELHVAYEYALKKEEEKELLREAREKEREEKKLQKQLEKEKNKFNRENDKIETEIEKVKRELNEAAESEKQKLENEIKQLKEALNRNNDEIEKIDKWKETPGAGYVYIISNIGSFGEGVFKIGVTRRDKPDERIRELSSASVPFRYDTHVFIFSKNAYELEKELHERFDKQRVNKVNRRKEFFKITIDDVKQIVEENKADVHSFVEKAEAEEYYDTLKIEKRLE